MRIAILTAPRKINLITPSLDSYFDSGFKVRPDVFCEPDSDHFRNMDKCTLHTTTIQRGIFANWERAARYCLAVCTEDFFIIAEDDVKWTSEAAQYVRTLNIETTVGMISLWTSVANGRPDQYGMTTDARYDKEKWCGCLALCFHRKILEKVIEHPHFHRPDRFNHLDITIGEIIKNLGLRILVHTPSLVHHLGTIHSTLVKENNPALQKVTRQEYDDHYHATHYPEIVRGCSTTSIQGSTQ